MNNNLKIILLLFLLIPGIVYAASIQLTVKEWYPKGLDYVFVCSTTGLGNNITYNWIFGDGSKLLNMKNNNVYHTFPRTGDYLVTCTAKGKKNTLTTQLLVHAKAPCTNITTCACAHSGCFYTQREYGTCLEGYEPYVFITNGTQYIRCTEKGYVPNRTLTIPLCREGWTFQSSGIDQTRCVLRTEEVPVCTTKTLCT